MKKGTDIAISFDHTGSMSSVLGQVKSNVNRFIDNMFDQVDNLRMAVIVHNDYCDFPKVIDVLDLTSDKAALKRFVSASYRCGGGDSPECYELALAKAADLDWKAEKRSLVLIGDEEPHKFGYTSGGQRCIHDWKEETGKLKDLGVTIYSVQALGSRHTEYFYKYIAATTGGKRLELSQFAHISTYITAVAYHQQGEAQLDAYQKSNPSFSQNLSIKNMFAQLRGKVLDTSADADIETLGKFQLMEVIEEMPIKAFVENNGCTFRKGKGYYQLIGTTADGRKNWEEIQPEKEVIFVNKRTGVTNSNTAWCRKQLGVPLGTSGKVRLQDLPDIDDKYEIFVQSTSVNRKLDQGTKFLYELEHI